MKFRTGFVVGCAATLYVTEKARRLRAPIVGQVAMTGPTGDWPLRGIASTQLLDSGSEKVKALGGLARERALDVLRGPLADLARDRAVSLFEGAMSGRSS